MLSANLNSLATTLYEDGLKEFMEKRGWKNTNWILKSLVVVIGLTITVLTYVPNFFQNLFSFLVALISMPLGVLLGMFTLGVLVPRANSKVNIINVIAIY